MDSSLPIAVLLLAACQLTQTGPVPQSNPAVGEQSGNYKWLSPVYPSLYSVELPMPPVAGPISSEVIDGVTIDYFEETIESFSYQEYPNLPKTNLVGINGSYPGPTFRVQRGHEAVVRIVNNDNYDDSNTNCHAIHLHGSWTHAAWDGWASNTFCPGQYMDYYYPNSQSGRSLWYHGHADHHTSKAAYYGMGGFWIIEDEGVTAVGLPSGDYDIPLLINARQYQSDGQLFFQEGALIYGDVIEVNGQPWPYMNVEPRKYLFRLLDAAIARAFMLSVQDADGNAINFDVVGSDGGLLSQSVSTNSLSLSMGERWEIVVDFSNYSDQNLTMMNARHVQEDADYAETDKVLRFVVGSSVSDSSNNGDVPFQLASNIFPVSKSEPDQRFVFLLGGNRTDPTEWTINGVTFDDPNNRILANPALGSTELWEITNGGGGLHPVHVHLIDFQVVSRSVGLDNGVSSVLPYEAAAWKDVVYVGEGETVQILAKFAPWAGVYMFHCHNLVHEDHAMMDAFNVSSLVDFGYPETLEFQDPEDPRFLGKDLTSDATAAAAGPAAIASFAVLSAYANAASIYSDINAATVATPTPSVTASAQMSFGAGQASLSFNGGPGSFTVAVPSYTAFPSSGPAAQEPAAATGSGIS